MKPTLEMSDEEICAEMIDRLPVIGAPFPRGCLHPIGRGHRTIASYRRCRLECERRYSTAAVTP
jgi:hypothetical protein